MRVREEEVTSLKADDATAGFVSTSSLLTLPSLA